jgi:hypothetical protein
MLTGGASSDAWLVRRQLEALDELLGWVGRLRGVHAETDHLVATELDDLLRHLDRHRHRILPVHVGDEQAAHPEVGFGGACAVDQPVDDRRHRHAADRVQCGVEEHLAVLEVAQLHAVLERLVRDASEVVAVDHGRVHESEDLEELVDGGVVVDAVDVGRRQTDVVLAREVDDGRGPQRSLHVAVQLDLREPAQVLLVLHRPPQPANASIIAPTSSPSG